MKKTAIGTLILLGTTFFSETQYSRRSTWNGIPRNTVAERLATKYDPQARALRYSTGKGYQKVPHRHYRRYHRFDRRYRKPSRQRYFFTRRATEKLGIDAPLHKK